MSIPLDGDLPVKCDDYVKTGTVFRLFTTDCDWKLHKFKPGDNIYRLAVPRETNRQKHIDFEKTKGIVICEDVPEKPFEKKGFLLRMRPKRLNPFAGLTWFFRSNYSQGINFTFMDTTVDYTASGTIGEDDTFLEFNWSIGTIPDKYEMQSTGVGSGTIRADFQIPERGLCDEPTINVVARLASLGAETETDAGTGIGRLPNNFARGGVRQESGKVLHSVDPFRTSFGLRGTAAWFWTGVHWAQPDWTDPPNEWAIGLIMTLNFALSFGV